MRNNLLTTTALTCAVGFAAIGLGVSGFAGTAAGGTDVGNGYVGIGASIVTHDGCVEENCGKPDAFSATSDEDRVTWTDLGGKVFGGWRFHKNVAVEAGYHYFSKAEESSNETYVTQGVSIAFLGILPVTSAGSVFAKAGAMWGWVNEEGTSNNQSSSGFSPILGLGANGPCCDSTATASLVIRARGVAALMTNTNGLSMSSTNATVAVTERKSWGLGRVGISTKSQTSTTCRIAPVIAGGVSMITVRIPPTLNCSISSASASKDVFTKTGVDASRSFHQSARLPCGSISIIATGPWP